MRRRGSFSRLASIRGCREMMGLIGFIALAANVARILTLLKYNDVGARVSLTEVVLSQRRDGRTSDVNTCKYLTAIRTEVKMSEPPVSRRLPAPWRVIDHALGQSNPRRLPAGVWVISHGSLPVFANTISASLSLCAMSFVR